MKSFFFGSGEFLNSGLRKTILLASVLIFAFFFWSSTEARKGASNRVLDWLPDGIEETKVFNERYFAHFQDGGLLMASWAGCNLEDERLDRVAEILLAPGPEGRPAYFERVMTSRSVLEMLRDEPLELRRREALPRLDGWLVGKNGTDACLIAVFSEAGREKRGEAVETLFATIGDVTQLSRADIHIAGPSIDSVAIDEISKTSQRTLLPFFLVFCLVLLFLSLRNLFATMTVFFVAVTNEELAGTLLYWTGAHVDSISMLTSSLVYVLTISGGVHLVNYYRETLQDTDEKTAPRETLRKAFVPCSLAVLTTVLGMGSLTVSGMIPIRTFGIFGSAALMIGTAWLFLFVTTSFQQNPIRAWAREGRENRRFQVRRKIFWNRWGKIVWRFRHVISVLGILTMLFLAFGVKNLKTSVTFHGMLPDSAKVIRDYAWFEERVGGLIPVEVVLEVPAEGNEKVTLLDQLYLLESMREVLAQTEGVETTISALNFLPALPGRTDFRKAAHRAALASVLKNHRASLKQLQFFDYTEGVDPEDSDSFWRISVRISSQDPIDYDVFLAEMRSRLETLRTSEVTRKMSGLRFDVTGAVPLVHRAQEQLFTDLISSFISAFGLIALTMMLLLRGVVRGLLAMIPNIFPCIIVFGALGWMGKPIDMGSMMTASVAMGIAVDGTLHFLTWFNIGIKQGHSRRQAVFVAFRRCASALLQTTIICGVGMLVFSVSDFVPVSRFSVMMCLLLVFSFIGDIILLPAILMGPLGRFVSKQ